MKYSIIIPCYNEEDNIADLILLLETKSVGLDLEWILVENGSKDRTREQLEQECQGKPGFRIVYVDINQGYGYGLQKGLEQAQGDYVGWLHADMQVSPDYLLACIHTAEQSASSQRLFFKGKRQNRSLLDNTFTGAMTVFATLLFGRYLCDIGAVPVLFHRELMDHLTMLPYDFSIETYVYYQAKQMGYTIKRFPVDLANRIKGQSSWNKGLHSKLKQSGVIIKDLIKIKHGVPIR